MAGARASVTRARAPAGAAGLALPSPDDQRAGGKFGQLRRGGARIGGHPVAAGFCRHRGGRFCPGGLPAGEPPKPDGGGLPDSGAAISGKGGDASGAGGGAGRAAVSPVRSICTRCCRCRTPILQLGPTHPTALAWLAAHWGITDRLRQVVVRDNATTGRRLPRGHAVIGYGFFTDGETPHAAIDRLAKRWPALRFGLMPRPAD